MIGAYVSTISCSHPSQRTMISTVPLDLVVILVFLSYGCHLFKSDKVTGASCFWQQLQLPDFMWKMANAEVSVPVGDVVVVPTEGNDGENPEDTKTQVILQLQPVQQGWVNKDLDILKNWRSLKSGESITLCLLSTIEHSTLISKLAKFWPL